MSNQSSPTTAKGFIPKAGKKKMFTPPPDANPEKLTARYQGEQQFVAKEFPAPLPARKGSWDLAMDVLCRAFRVKRIRPLPSNDVGARWDKDRKRLILPPNRREER